MLDNKHEAISPPEENCTLWRYMDLTKLLSLLETATLAFPRADRFHDPYEGTWAVGGLRRLEEDAKSGKLSAPDASALIPHAKRMFEYAAILREQMFISCWFASPHESAAMWELYLQSPEGVAIRTDYESLARVLEKSNLTIRTSLVKYIDYAHSTIPFNNGFYPFVHKRLSFAHENEVRALIWAEEGVNKSLIEPGVTCLFVEIEVAVLVSAIYVSPTAPRWFGQLVEQVLRRYGLRCPVERSRLYDRPVY